MTAARLLASGQANTLLEAAACCGSSVHYVRAAAILLKAERTDLLRLVLDGRVALLAAARKARPVADLVTAYRKAGAEDRAVFRSIVDGVPTI